MAKKNNPWESPTDYFNKYYAISRISKHSMSKQSSYRVLMSFVNCLRTDIDFLSGSITDMISHLLNPNPQISG